MIADYYDQSAVILAKSTSTGWGNEGGYSTGGTTIECAISIAGGDEKKAQGRPMVDHTHRLYCRSTESLSESDRVVWNSKNLNIVLIKDTLQRGHHLLVLLKEQA